MKITALLAAVSVCLAMAEARETKLYAEKVEPFPEPTTTKGTVGTAIKFKPKFYFLDGCSPYPAVNKAGMTSKGLSQLYGDCNNPMGNSQIYSRGCWYEKRYAMMFSWYIPGFKTADWPSPNVNKPDVLGISFSTPDGYESQFPPVEGVVSGSTVAVEFYRGRLKSTIFGELFQDLITWELLTKEARHALNSSSSFHSVHAPFNDHQFHGNIKKAWESRKQLDAQLDEPATYQSNRYLL